MRTSRGFTLLELLVVVMIIALGAALTSLALRDSDAQRLDEEAARLSALLEAARLESRASGMTVRWRALPAGDAAEQFRFELEGMPAAATVKAAAKAPVHPVLQLPQRWLYADTSAQVEGAGVLVLGPEPILSAQAVRLQRGKRQLRVGTQGWGPFQVLSGDAP